MLEKFADGVTGSAGAKASLVINAIGGRGNMLSRKDQAKMNYLNSPEGAALKKSVIARGIPINQISDTMLPDDFKFDGWKVVDGQFCKTVGEYKKALAKYDDMG